MHLSEFLSHHGIELGDVYGRVRDAVCLAPGDILFACGSLVEGLGNMRSDIDFFLVTSRDDIAFTSQGAVTTTVGACIVDVRVVAQPIVEALLGRFEAWARAPRDERAALGFADEERKLLYRLSTGRALFGEAAFERLRERVGRRDLARLRLDRARYLAFTVQIDLAGLHLARDLRSLVFAAQELLAHTADALLAGALEAQPGWKWRIRRLGELSDDWEHELPGRPSGLTACDLYCALHRAPPDLEDEEVVYRHAVRIAALSRRVFPWAERRLLAASTAAIPGLHGGGAPGGSRLPALELDVAVRYDSEAYVFMRLNTPGSPVLTLAPETYALLALFDGETPITEAVALAERVWGQQWAERLDDLREIVRLGNFEARDLVDEGVLAKVLNR